MKQEKAYGWYIPDKETRTQKLITGKKGATAGTQGNIERELAISYCGRSNEIVFDIGGHVGIFAKAFTERFEHTIVFEPLPEHVECIEANLKDVDENKYEIHHVALGDSNKRAKVYYADKNTGQSRILEDGIIYSYANHIKEDITEDDLEKGELIETKVMKLDDYIEMNDSLHKLLYEDNKKLSLMKIDVEGHEPNVLRGAKKIIEHAKPIIMVELLDHGKKEGGYGQEVFLIMKDYKYNYITKAKKNFIFAHEDSGVKQSNDAYIRQTKRSYKKNKKS
tara:strand:+ start:4177 stop:5013 length:837 start_codon:yes stop_codon:yes gene_type:complete